MPRPRRPRNADVEINASARADEMKVRTAPDVAQRREAEPGGETAAGSDRENLPDRVREGETYQHIRIDYRIAGKVADKTAGDEERGDTA